MSLTLGEKLRQAREGRGLSLSEVSEQTRISPLYLESIENDDYRILPGGIFNKGFVKSYAKFVGLNEQEALSDYSQIVSQTETTDDEELKVYRPEVLTDDRASSSTITTIILAAVILGLMSAGIYFLVNYVRQPAEPVGSSNVQKPPANALPEATPAATPSDQPQMGAIKVEVKVSEPVSLTAVDDGKTSSNVVPAGEVRTFQPKDSLKLGYSKSLASAVQLSINGKLIALPSQPINPVRKTIEFEINKDTLPQIWASGSITGEAPSAVPTAETNANVASPVTSSSSAPRPTPAPKPSAAANTANKSVPANKPAATPKPPATTPRPETNRE